MHSVVPTTWLINVGLKFKIMVELETQFSSELKLKKKHIYHNL